MRLAIIIVWGPQITTSTASTQDYFDATQGGVADYVAASGDQNVIYIDNSVGGGKPWLTTALDTILFNTGQAHMKDVGQPVWGYRAAQEIIAAVRSKYGI